NKLTAQKRTPRLDFIQFKKYNHSISLINPACRSAALGAIIKHALFSKTIDNQSRRGRTLLQEH
ncbi:MAG: hypothetical protein KAR12_13075, partial [Methylococcales bacterium]|nr:hypothetical protein [Methylococcales bacterium]